jgi:hypothetical protein
MVIPMIELVIIPMVIPVIIDVDIINEPLESSILRAHCEALH